MSGRGGDNTSLPHQREKVYCGAEMVPARRLECQLGRIFLSMYLPANLPQGVSIYPSTNYQSRPIHYSLASLTICGHCYSIILRGSEPFCIIFIEPLGLGEGFPGIRYIKNIPLWIHVSFTLTHNNGKVKGAELLGMVRHSRQYQW